MIARTLGQQVARLAQYFPVLTVTGPRQSGKTTLCRTAFPEHRYVSLEVPDIRAFARSDPRGFLDPLRGGAVIDEVQRLPDLLSYLQGEVDTDPRPGRFILTGSANLALVESVSQSLAGRTALLQLLPCSLDEVRLFPGTPLDLLATVWTGGYPAIFDRSVPAGEWLGAYVATYVERDARQLLNIGDLETF
ncbi:MAG: AAA family ATPase, partial [Thermoanaerobaculaceae bacterium]|nr:AAA family ATPase [Thermoanaerobaculaceae bacterium]